MTLSRVFDRGARVYAGLILCFFAFVPGWIDFQVLRDAIVNLHSIDLAWITAVTVCTALCYFLLLLAYRAITGRGRKADGGLLPHAILQVFAVTFAAMCLFAIAYGAYRADWLAVIHGLLEFFAAVAVFKLAALRRERAEMWRPPGSSGPPS